MELSQSDCNILNSINQVLSAAGSNTSQIIGLLHLLNMELQCSASFVFLCKEDPELPVVLHAFSEEVLQKRDILENQAKAAFRDSLAQEPIAEGWKIHQLPSISEKPAAMVCYMPQVDPEPALALFSSSIFLLLKNEGLQDMLAQSREIANQHIDEIAAIYEIGAIANSSTINPQLDLIVRKASAVMDAQACSLMLVDDSGSLVISASYGLDEDIIKNARMSFGEGIAGHVAVTGEAMRISDVAADPRFGSNVSPRAGISGSMCVPLKDEFQQVYGVLSMRRHLPKPPFTEDDLKLFQVFGTHASFSLSNAELYSRLNRKIEEMASISDVLKMVNSSLALEDRLDSIARAIKNVVAFDRCCVYLLEDKEFVCRAYIGYENPEMIVETIPAVENAFSIAASEHLPIFTNSLHTVHQSQDAADAEILIAPIVVKDACIGIVVVDNPDSKKSIDQEQVMLLSAFVNQAGIAVENARLYQAMQQNYNELNVLYEHSRAISAAYGLKNVSDAVIESCNNAVKCSGSGVILLDTIRDSAELVTSSGDFTKVAPNIEKVLATPEGLHHIRAQRQPQVANYNSADRNSCPVALTCDKRWPSQKKNALMIPLITEDTVIGVVVLLRNHADVFTESDSKLASIIVGHAATVIRNAYIAQEQMSQKVLELSALYDFSGRITSASTLNEAFESILAILAGLVDFDESFVYVIDRERGVAEPVSARFRDAEGVWPEAESLDGPGLVSWVVNEGKAVVSSDLKKDRRYSEFHKDKDRSRSVMVLPLVVHGEVVATLVVRSENPKQYTQDNVRVLSIIASQGAAIFSELQALNRLANYTDNILASIDVGVVTLDQHRNIISWNAAAERITGVEAQRIIGTSGYEALSHLPIKSEERTIIHNAISEVINSQRTYNGHKLAVTRYTDTESEHSESVTAYINMRISLLRDQQGNNQGLVVIFENVTGEIEMENKLRRMSELAAIGQLAANIAHELRNPLSSIRGSAQFLRTEYLVDAALAEFLGIIIEEVDGLNNLTTEFLDFASPVQFNYRPTSINKLIEKNLHLMRITIENNDVSISTNLDPALPEIEADGSQIERVLRNIILNAIQAMPNGGLLHIETESKSEGISMSVSDTGTGIPEQEIERVFQPFFTTKTKGTGLGLSIVNKIVENHNGKLIMESVEDQGTKVKVILPLTGEGTVITYDEEGTALTRRVSRGLREL